MLPETRLPAGPVDTYSLFQNGGIAHIIAISGLHLSLIAGAVSKLLRRLGAHPGGGGIPAGERQAAE